jgi:hypothetical protein
MKTIDKATRRVIVTLAVLVAIIIASIALDLTNQVAAWVAQSVIVLVFGRLCFLAGWGVAKNGKGWRV